MDENEIIVCIGIGIFLGMGVCIAVNFLDVADGEVGFMGGRFVRVDAEPVEDWCEEWVCEEYVLAKDLARVDYDMTELEFVNGEYVICKQRKLVRRRC